MRIAKNFTIYKYKNGIVSITDNMRSIILYKIPYSVMKKKKISTPNRFINYILISETEKKIYVGKTKNGLYDKKRPSEHEDKCKNWTDCIVITTKTDEFLNDGVIQYIENELNTKFSDLKYYENITVQTTTQTANSKEQINCERYLRDIFQHLNILYPTLTCFLSEKEKEPHKTKIKNKQDIKSKNITLKTLKNEIKKVNKNITFINKKDYINVHLDGKNFATIYTVKNGYDVFFRAKENDFDNKHDLLKPIPSSAHRIGNWKLQVVSKKDFNTLKDYLNQTINL